MYNTIMIALFLINDIKVKYHLRAKFIFFKIFPNLTSNWNQENKCIFIFLESNGDTPSSSNSTSGVRLPRTKSVRFSDGYAPGKINKTLNENREISSNGIMHLILT